MIPCLQAKFESRLLTVTLVIQCLCLCLCLSVSVSVSMSVSVSELVYRAQVQREKARGVILAAMLDARALQQVTS